MTSIGIPEPGQGGRSDDLHNKSVRAALDLLSQLHPPGSFNLNVTTHGSVSVVVATDNPQFTRERSAVAEDFETIETILKLAEQRPAIGSIHPIIIGGRSVTLKVDSMGSLLSIVQLGIDTAIRSYTLTEEEQQQIQRFSARMEALK